MKNLNQKDISEGVRNILTANQPAAGAVVSIPPFFKPFFGILQNNGIWLMKNLLPPG